MAVRLAVAASIWLMAAGCSSATNPPQAAASPSSSQVGVRFTGAVTGTMISKAGFGPPSCQLPRPYEVPKVWVYRVIGTVGLYHDVAFEIGVDDYKGPATYRNSAISIVILGPIGTDLKASQTFESSGNGTLVINADELSGSIDTTVRAHPSYPGGTVNAATAHVHGTFTCKSLRPRAESP